MYRFYGDCNEVDALYLKVDDDICYVHDDFFRRILGEALAKEETHLACVGNVFNIPYVTQVLQEQGTLGDQLGKSTGDPRCPVACTNGEFAAYIHKQFLALAEAGMADDLCFPSREIRGRQRIGVMAWTGRNFARWNVNVGPRDEVDLTTKIPEGLSKPLWMVGAAVVSHFAFSHQRAVLEDQTNILGRYLALSVRLNGDVAV